MKLAPQVLLEIVDLVRQGLLSSVDISDKLRELDLVRSEGLASETLVLSPDYLSVHPRGSDWKEE